MDGNCVCLDFDLCRLFADDSENRERHGRLGDWVTGRFHRWHFASVRSLSPFLIRYTTLREEELQKRLDELKDV